MTDIITRLNKELDKDIIDRMLDIITDVDPDNLTEEQIVWIANIIDMVDPTVNEIFKRRQRRDLGAWRKRRREHRRHRAQKRIKARKYRRSAKGKKTLRRAKRLGKFGRTSTYKRKRVFVGPKLAKIQRLK